MLKTVCYRAGLVLVWGSVLLASWWLLGRA